MLFNTLEYAVFLPLSFALYWLCAPHRKARLSLLLGLSYVFYAFWDPRFLPLLFASSSVDWWLAHRIANTEEPAQRKRLLAVTLCLNLGVLAVFKYLGFGVESARSVFLALGFDPPALALEIALPIGISFFTFESMSYVIDVYRKQLEPHESYLEYLCFVAFFPHLVAGPIVRPRDLLPQLARPPRFTNAAGSRGLFLIAVGLLKKVAIGDYLALNLVDRVFDAPLQYSSLECYAAVVGYAVQIYCDFSGYTDIAIGSALLFGIRFPQNFDSPYKAANVQDFWRRWHISLSTWLRDYLYVSLGGNRRGEARTYVNLMLTMLLGGLWHGASWNFVLWGGLHGGALCVTRAFGARRGTEEATRGGQQRLFLQVASTVATFHFVCFAWIFFRSESFSDAGLILDRLGQLSFHRGNLPATVVAVLGVGLASHFFPERWFTILRVRLLRGPVAVQGMLLFGVAWIVRNMSGADAVPFVYFQF